jgi:exonuclease SbcC
MRPLHLTIEGLRSFRTPPGRNGGAGPRKPTIDFTGRDHIAIVGDTGAGKSSILEAITYALYGQTTFTARANQELMNDTSTHLRVVLRFQVSGEIWEVTRTLRRSGQRDVGQVRAVLRRVGDDDETVEQVEQVRRVNERIEALLGLDSDAFLRTVVLPQGRFARLLVEDEPRDRSRILRQVWRTDELEAAGEVAGAARRETETLRIQLEQAASEYPEEPASHLEQLRETLDTAVRRAAAASENEHAASTAREALLAAQQAEQAASEVVARLREVDPEQAAGRLAPIAAIERQLAAEEAALQERQAQLENAQARIPTDDGPTSEEVAAALTTLQSLPPLVKASEEAAAALRASTKDASTKRTEAERAADSAAAAEKRYAEHAARRPLLDEAARTAQERQSAVERKHARCAELAVELDQVRKQLDTLRTEEAGCARGLESAREAERRAAREATSADEHLAVAQRAESAAAAAHDLHPGDACPICRRDLPAHWEAPDGTKLIQAQQVAKVAHDAVREATGKVTVLDTQREGIRGRIADGEVGLDAAQTRFRDARQELAREIDLDANAPLPAPEALIGPLEAARKETAEHLAGHDRVAEDLREEAARTDKTSGVAQEAAANAHALVERSRRAAEDALEGLRTATETIPRPFRPGLDLPADVAGLHEVDTGPVRECTASADQRAQVLNARKRQHERLRSEIEGVREARSALAGRRADQVDAPIDALVGELNAHRDVLVKSVSQLGLDTNVPAAVSARDAAALESHIGELDRQAAQIARAAQARSRESSAEAAASRAALAAIGERLGTELDSRDIEAVVAAARARAEDARFEERRARESADHFAGIVDDVRRLRELLGEVRDKERALGDLEDALKPGAFLKWLTLRRSRRLLVHASRMLGEMSGGKYAFVDPGEADEQWRVLDTASGQDRSPASLSGGEQFIASLSLALGMVEMMARSGGRLESLFLDEGFGSLDRNNLDAAVQALGTVAAGGRMVGVISHVRAVAEQIDHVLAVTRGATGSRAEWLTSRQREHLSESDTGLEAAAAMAGLLE